MTSYLLPVVHSHVGSASTSRRRKCASIALSSARCSGIGGPQVELAQDAGLNEYDFQALFAALGEEGSPLGLSAGLSASTSKKDFYKGLRQVLQLWTEDRLPGQVPETWRQFQTRVERARIDIQRAGGKRVLMVSSGGPIAVTAQQVLQAPAATAIALNMQIRNSSVCQYVFNDAAMSLVSFNSVPHLEHAERHEFVTYG
jgi:broad specificity phosphatase PhoE